MKVTLAIDASEQAAKAFNWYINELHKPGNSVTLLHCPEAPSMTTEVLEAGNNYVYEQDVYIKKAEEANTSALEVQKKYQDLLKKHQIQGSVEVLGNTRPGEAISKHVNEMKPGMVVMGCRGLGTLRRTIMGSVSQYVANHVNCPVLICKHDSS